MRVIALRVAREETTVRTALAGLTVVAVAVGVMFVLATMLGEDESTGSVTVVGDLLEVSPDENWLVVESVGGAADSGVQELTFTNPQPFDTQLLFLDHIVQTPPPPNAFDEALSLSLGVKDPVTGCPDPLPKDVHLSPGTEPFSLDILAGESLTLCGLLAYDGSLGPVNESVDLAFVFTSSGSP